MSSGTATSAKTGSESRNPGDVRSAAVVSGPGRATALADAAEPHAGAACSLDGWVQACYVPLGDVIWVKDTRADGYHADVQFWWGGDAWQEGQTCHNRLGAAAGWTTCDQFADMIPEHDVITLWPLATDDDENIVPNGGGGQITSSTT